MLPSLYDLRLVEERYRDFRREAAEYRVAQISRTAPVPGPSLSHRIRRLMMRLHLVRPVHNRAEVAA